MAALGFSYDFSQLPEFEEYSTLPKGQWNVCIIDGEVKASGTTTRLQLKFRVLDGSHAGSEFTDNFTLMHDNEKAQTIGQQRLGAIQRAVNWLQALSDVAQIANKPFTVRTDIRFYPKNDGGVGSAVDVKKITPYVGANMATGADPVQPTPPAPEAPAPALGGLPSPGGLRLPTATPAMAAPQAPAVAAPVGMPAGMVLPGQNTLGTQPPVMTAPVQSLGVAASVGMLPGMPAQAPAMAAPPAGAPMFRLPGQ